MIHIFIRNKQSKFLSALVAPLQLIFISSLLIAFEAKLLTNPSKLSLDKGIAIIFCVFFA